MVTGIFVHGFMGSDESFHSFPSDLKSALESQLKLDFKSHQFVYQTKGENADKVNQLIDFIESRTSPYDKVLLLAHSMGGLLCVDALREWKRRERVSGSSKAKSDRVTGIIAFDSPFFGLARNVIAESGLQKATKAVSDVSETVSSFWNAISSSATSSAQQTTARSATTASPAEASGSKSLGWGVLAAATAFGAFAAYQSSPVLQTQVNTIAKQVIQEHTSKVVEHAQFLGPLWQVTDMKARMEFIASSPSFFFHGFYLKMASTEKSFISLSQDPSIDSYFSVIPILNGSDEIDAHMHLFQAKNEHYLDLLMKTISVISQHQLRW